MLKCDFNKGALQVIEIFFRHRCSPINLLHIFGIPFYKNSYGGLLLFLPLCNDSMTQICYEGSLMELFMEIGTSYRLIKIIAKTLYHEAFSFLKHCKLTWQKNRLSSIPCFGSNDQKWKVSSNKISTFVACLSIFHKIQIKLHCRGCEIAI